MEPSEPMNAVLEDPVEGDAKDGPAPHEAHPANGAPTLDPQATGAPLEIAPSPFLDPLSEIKPPGDTSGQAPVEGIYRGGEEQAPSEDAPSGTSGGSRPRHHLLRHTLPPELSGLNCVRHFGVDGVAAALRLVQTMSQRDLQQAFEKVYSVKSSSNNNNWLRKKLVEALVPRESSNDPEVDSILEELASRSGARKRQKEWTSAASGGVDGWRGHHMPPQLNPYAAYPTAAFAATQAAQAAAAATTAPTNQRKSSKVRPSPTDAAAGYNGNDWGAPVEEVTAAGRKKRRAAAGVAAATAAVLRDPALEEIEKADLRRAAMGDFERRWGTGNSGYGGRGGRGGYSSGRARAEREVVEAPSSQQDLAKTLQNLTHLLSIAVQQGKLAPPPPAAGGWGGAAPAGMGALGAIAAQSMQAQYAHQQQHQHYGQPPPQLHQQYDQQTMEAPQGLAGALAALLQRQQHQGAQPQQGAWMGGFGGAPPAPAPAPPAPAPAPSDADQQTVLARLLGAMAQDPGRMPEQLQQLRAMAAQASGSAAAAQAATAAPPPPAAAATLQQVLAARIAQLRSAGADGQPSATDMPRQGSSDAPPAPAAAAAGPSHGTSIPGSNYPVDTMLMQLLQQQQAQRAAAAAPEEALNGKGS